MDLSFPMTQERSSKETQNLTEYCRRRTRTVFRVFIPNLRSIS